LLEPRVKEMCDVIAWVAHIRADSRATSRCSWPNPIHTSTPSAGRIVMTGSSPKRSHVQCRRERRMTIVLKMRGFRAMQGTYQSAWESCEGAKAGTGPSAARTLTLTESLR
jgi:hypothetical protein